MINYVLPNQGSAIREKSGFSAIDYDLPIKGANAAEIHLTERYPAFGYALNKESEMVVKILDGEVVFFCDGEEVTLPTGSVVLVEPNKKYCWKPNPEVTLYIVSTPPWTLDQHKSIHE